MPPKAETTPKTVEQIARSEAVGHAFRLLDDRRDWITERQIELTLIPAPTFGEKARAAWFEEQFAALGLEKVRRDEIGNVLGELPGAGPARSRRAVAVTAHLDTVFPRGERVEVVRQNGRIYAPGITDNGAGLAALLALAAVVRESRFRCRDSVLFIANVAEEGEGNLFGMRYLFDQPEIRKSVKQVLVIDGANVEHVTAHALGSLRFQVNISGPGGHSWTDYGTAHPIQALASAVCQLMSAPMPAQPRTTLNVGEIHGGISINSIPALAAAKVDIRSGSVGEMHRVAALLERAVRQAVEAENQRAHTGRLTYEIKEIGERPAADLPDDARILEVMREADRFLGIRSRIERSSTDANIPLSLGIEALSVGGGGSGGCAHSLDEWYDPAERTLGLRRLLLAICALAGVEL